MSSSNKLGLRYGLDIDGVLCNFSAGIIKLAKERGVGHLFPSCSEDVNCWDMTEDPKHFLDIFLDVQTKPEFWLNIPPIKSSQKFFQNGFCFVPEMYITKRAVPSEVSAEWLAKNKFPLAEVITVDNPEDKAAIVKDRCDVYVDDLIETCVNMRKQNINAILFEAPYQRGHVVPDGLPRIKDLSELCGKRGFINGW